MQTKRDMKTSSRLEHVLEHVSPSAAAAGFGAAEGDYPVARHPDGSPVAPSDLPGRTPLDIRLGLTQPEGVAFRLRWGILGSAKICEDWARALGDIPGASVVAIAARSGDSAKNFAEKLGIPKSYEGYENVANDPDVDIVYIGTITALHKQHALMCIAAGKHVLVEKPIAISKADSEEMYAAAAAKGVMCQEGMWTRYFPAVEHARSLIDSGAIGQVRLVQADMGGLMLGGDKSEMLMKRGIANSMLSCYAVQSGPFGIREGSPAKITAAGYMPEGYDVFTSAGASVEFDTDVRSICALTWTMEAPLSRKAVISGTHGRITLEGGAAPTKLTMTTNPKPDAYPGAYHGLFVPIDETVITYALADPAGLRPGAVREDLGGERAPDYNYPNTHGFVYQGEAVHRCLAAGLLQCPQFSVEESLACMTILDGIETALRSQPGLPPSPFPQFPGQLPHLPSAVANGLAPETPLDIKMGLTSPQDVSHRLRWGFMTAGRICKDMAMAIKIAQTRGCGATLGAVAARKLADAEAFANDLGCARAYGGDSAYADICADPDIDILYVGTITPLHAEHALMALRGGKHVLCEKPFASNGAEVAQMYAEADAVGVLLQEGMWSRFFPATEHARSALAEGVIGQPRVLQSTFSDRCYPSQAAPMVFGTSSYPTVATVGGGEPRPNSGGSATLVYPCGGVASVTVPSGYEFSEDFNIFGTEGQITIHTPGHCPTKVTVNGTTFEYPLEKYSYFDGYPQCNQHGFYYEVEAVHRCLSKDLRETPQHTRADSLQLIWIIDQMRAQAGGNAHG